MKNLKYYASLIGLTTTLVLTQQPVVFANNIKSEVINNVEEQDDDLSKEIEELNELCKNIKIVVQPNLLYSEYNDLFIKCIDTNKKIEIDSKFYSKLNKLLTIKNNGEFKTPNLYLIGLDDEIDFNKIFLLGIKRISIYNSQKDFNYRALSKENYYGNDNQYESIYLSMENDMITSNLNEWLKTQNFNDTYLYIEYLGDNAFSSNAEIINSLSCNESCIKTLNIANEIYSSEYLNNVTKINAESLYLTGFFKLSNDSININLELNKHTNYLNLTMVSDELNTTSRVIGDINIKSSCPDSSVAIYGVHNNLIIDKNTKFKLKNFDGLNLLGVDITSKLPFYKLTNLNSLSINSNYWYRYYDQKYYEFLYNLEIDEKKYTKQ